MSSPYSIRPVPALDFAAASDIYATSFIDYFGRAPARNMRFVEVQLSLLVGGYVEDELVGLTGVIDFDLHFGERWVPCAGIAGVATLPNHRRRGLVKLMLAECLRGLHDRRIPLACLWPF